jgi:hypothetical protein
VHLFDITGMKKMSIANLKKFCTRHGLTLLIQENGYPVLICTEDLCMIAQNSDKGRFWDFKPTGKVNDLDQFMGPYTELNGEWF